MPHDGKDGQVFNRETNTSESVKPQTVIADVTVGAKTSLKAYCELRDLVGQLV